MKKLLIVAPILLALTAMDASAGSFKNRSFNATSSQTTAQGTRTRAVSQQATENGYMRQRSTTLANGQTKSVDKLVTRNAETGTRTAQQTRTGYNGQTQTRNAETVRTENGYQHQAEVTNANGQSVQRNVNAQYDKENGTASKEITRTNAAGESQTRTVERTVTKETSE